jgi:hypothetical protein
MKTTRTTGALPTDFVNPDQLATLSQALDMSAEQVDQVSGGLSIASTALAKKAADCSCVNCCSNHLSAIRALPTMAVKF